MATEWFHAFRICSFCSPVEGVTEQDRTRVKSGREFVAGDRLEPGRSHCVAKWCAIYAGAVQALACDG